MPVRRGCDAFGASAPVCSALADRVVPSRHFSSRDEDGVSDRDAIDCSAVRRTQHVTRKWCKRCVLDFRVALRDASHMARGLLARSLARVYMLCRSRWGQRAPDRVQ